MHKNFISLFKKIILKILLITLLMSIFLTSINSYLNNYNQSWFMEINKKLITPKNVQQMFLKELSKIKSIDKKKYIQTIENKLKIKALYKKIIKNFINNIAIEDYFNKLKIFNDKKNIKNLIIHSQTFQTNHIFNKEKYNKFLQKNFLNEDQYLKIIETNLVKNFFLNDIINSEFLLNDEKVSNYKNKSKIIFYKIASINYKKYISKKKIPQKKILKFYKKYKKNFYVPKKFKIRFIDLSSFINKCNKNKKQNIRNYNIEKKIQYLSINQKNYLNLIEKLTKIQKKDTKWFSINSIPKEINLENIKNFLKIQKYYKINKINNLINYHFKNSKKNLYIQIIGFKQKKIQPFSKIKNKIEYILKKNKAKKKVEKILKKIEKELKNNLFYTFNNEKLSFQKQTYNTKFNKNNISIFVKKINEKFNKKKPIYVKMTDYKNTWLIIKLYKKIYTNLNKDKKNQLYNKVNLLNQKLLINLILRQLNLKTQIKYNYKYIIFKKYITKKII
ncbi:Periplasmic chaperone PpiD [Buchnera aphidicola (Periphyllus testudinaceus)]|uniref:SurA N-terminal domain-containing protein n=1 Tax=Buchnera aphidicola TaxID=9 RepID=UPI00346453E1